MKIHVFTHFYSKYFRVLTMLTNKRFLCTFLIGLFLFNAFCIDAQENVDSIRARINAESVLYKFDLADYCSHANGFADIYPFDECYYADIYIFTSMKQTQYHIIVSGENVQSYVEEFIYQAPYDTTNWTISPIKQFTYKTSELNPKKGTDEKMASFIVQIIAEELK